MNPICKLLSLQVCRYFRNGLHRCRRWCQTQADRMTESFQFQSERCIIELLILSANIHFVPNLSTAQFCYYESQQSERFRWSAWQKQNVYSCNFFLTAFNVLKEKRKSAALVFFVFIVSLRGTNSRGDKGDYSTLNHWIEYVLYMWLHAVPFDKLLKSLILCGSSQLFWKLAINQECF